MGFDEAEEMLKTSDLRPLVQLAELCAAVDAAERLGAWLAGVVSRTEGGKAASVVPLGGMKMVPR